MIGEAWQIVGPSHRGPVQIWAIREEPFYWFLLLRLERVSSAFSSFDDITIQLWVGLNNPLVLNSSGPRLFIFIEKIGPLGGAMLFGR